jgi:hypothetical protein
MKPDDTLFLPHTHGMLPIAGSWSPVLLVAFAHDRLALALSMIVAVLAIVDYVLKIAWKIRQSRTAERPDRDGDIGDEDPWTRGMKRTYRSYTHKTETHGTDTNDRDSDASRI